MLFSSGTHATVGCRRSGLCRAVAVTVALTVAGSAATASYTLRRGDTLSAVAAHFHVSVAALAAANHIPAPNRVFAGQVLVIPGPGGGGSVSMAAVGGSNATPGVLPSLLRHSPSRLALRPAFRWWSAVYGV